MKVIYTGLESSGKSLELARLSAKLVLRNSKWLKKTGIPRPLYTHQNLKYSDKFENDAQKLGIPIKYWRSLEELIHLTEGDVLIDEIGRFFDARQWEHMSADVKSWISMGAKQGIHIYGAAQDLSQVEKSFRLLINEVHHCVKLVGSPRPMKTAPKVKFIWGIYITMSMDPKTFDGDSINMIPKEFPKIRFITKDVCNYYDTSMVVEPPEPAPYKHIVRYCTDPTCVDRYGKPFKHVIHM